MIEKDGMVVYHAGDTEFIPEMAKLGRIDVALLPIDGKFCMNIEEAIMAAKCFKPKFVIPMHNHESNPQALKEKLEPESDIKVIALTHGESYQIY